MSRTLEEPLTERELAHFEREFWYYLVKLAEWRREEQGLERNISFDQAKEIMEQISKAIDFVKQDFQICPEIYSDVFAAEEDFFEQTLFRAKQLS